jgi:hypothetical protein
MESREKATGFHGKESRTGNNKKNEKHLNFMRSFLEGDSKEDSNFN